MMTGTVALSRMLWMSACPPRGIRQSTVSSCINSIAVSWRTSSTSTTQSLGNRRPRLEPCAHRRARRIDAALDHGVLEVEQHSVGAPLVGLLQEVTPAARDEQRAAHPWDSARWRVGTCRRGAHAHRDTSTDATVLPSITRPRATRSSMTSPP